jgi:RNA recognition motif-containing protein
MKIYVGNIPRESTESQIREAFEKHGEVTEVILIKDKYTNALKGFGFVEMPQKEQAETAIKSLEGIMFNGRALVVNPAKPKNESGDRPKRFNRY